MRPQLDVSKYYFNSRPILDHLPEKDLVLFEKHLRLKKVIKGRSLFQEGKKPDGIYILKKGKVKLCQSNQNGGEQIVYLYHAGEMFGYRPLLCDERHPASAVTIEDCEVYFLSQTHFLNVLKASVSLANILLSNLSHEFTVLINHIGAFARRSAKERIALSLLILRQKYKQSGSERYNEITLSRANLAAYAGTTNETLARIIGGLRKANIIKVTGRKIFVQDVEALAGVAGAT